MRKDSEATKERLLATAETLFAAHGVDNVSLVDITRQAGQKNRNALQYHFGNKEALINAVLDRHSQVIGERRAAMLDDLEGHEEYQLREAVAIFVVPVVQRLAEGQSGRDFIKINSQLMNSQPYAEARLARRYTYAQGKRLDNVLSAKLPKLGRTVLESRLLLMDCMLFNGLASYLSRETAPAPLAVFEAELVDAITAVLERT